MAELQTFHYFSWPLLFQIATILSVLLTLLLVSQILRSPRTPAATMSWLIVIIFLPLLGIPLYTGALRPAALRGVVVDMILPETSNHRLADIARNRHLRELAKAGARIWLLPRAMVRAKALLVDRSFALAGSANLDIRSLFFNYEVVSSFYSASDIDWLARWMETLRARAGRHTPRPAGIVKEMLEGLILLGAYEI